MQAAAVKTAPAQSADLALEVNYKDLTPELFEQTVKQYGGFLVRSLFAPEEAAELIREVGDLYFLIENLESNGVLASSGIRFLKGGHPIGLLPNMRLLQNILNKPNLIQALQKYFNDPELVVYLESAAVRSCNPKGWKNYLPWHQDLFHRGDRFFTIWIPLNRVGERSPGLEIVPKKLYERVDKRVTGLDVAYDGKGISEEAINQNVTTKRLQPVMDVGDVLIFDPYTAHRTFFREGMDMPRISLDVRINPMSANPAPPNPDATKEQWKTEMLRFPSKETVSPIGAGRPMFDVKHLLLPVLREIPATPAAGESAKVSLKRRVKNKVKKMVYEFVA